MTGQKEIVQDIIHRWKIKQNGSPAYIIKLLQDLYNVLEDVYSVGSVSEIQSAIDTIGTGSGTIFIESGTYEVDTPIDIDNCGSIVIYGHGDNTVLKSTGDTIFNITCCTSCIIKNIKLDVSIFNVFDRDAAVFVNEVNNNVVALEDVTIDGGTSGGGYGVDLTSQNCIVEHCRISGLNYGILLDGDGVELSRNHIISQNNITDCTRGIELKNATSGYCTITGNTTSSCSYRGIGALSEGNSVSGNTCNDNEDGILVQGSYNTISSNTCQSNTENGIYVSTGSYNTISGNTCTGNDADSANNYAGIRVAGSYNSITSNSSNNNNNIGAGTSYGIWIEGGTENVSISNNANGNDIDYMDAGTDTTIIYYVQDYEELQDAINSIGTRAGTIILDNSFTISTTIDIDGNGSYIIQGEGSNSTLTLDSDIKCFNITSARYVLMENFKIDGSTVGASKEIIDINEGSNRLVIIDNVEITGDGSNGYGIEINSNKCRIQNCSINNVNYGIICKGDNNLIENNTIEDCNNYGVYINGNNNSGINNYSNNNSIGFYCSSADYNQIQGNYIESNSLNGIVLNNSDYNAVLNNYCIGNDSNTGNPQAGIYIDADSDYNKVSENTTINNNNTGAGSGYGIYIANNNCDQNILKNNHIDGNDVTIGDSGSDTIVEYYVYSQSDIEDAITSIGSKAGTIFLPNQTITLTSSINISTGGRISLIGMGGSSIIDCGGNRKAFNITNIEEGSIFSNFLINGEDFTVPTGEDPYTSAIYIDDSDGDVEITTHIPKLILEKIEVLLNDDIGIGMWIKSRKCIIRECNIRGGGKYGIYIDLVEDCIIEKNQIIDNSDYGIYVQINSDGCIIRENYLEDNGKSNIRLQSTNNIITGNRSINSSTGTAIYLASTSDCVLFGNLCEASSNHVIELRNCDNIIISNNIVKNITVNDGDDYAGIYLNGDYCLVSNNQILDNTNAGAGTAYGISVQGNYNKLLNNLLSGNDQDYHDLYTNTVLYADDAAYGAAWNGDLGTPTKNVVYDELESRFATADGHDHDGTDSKQVSHDDLTDVSTSDHHTKTSDDEVYGLIRYQSAAPSTSDEVVYIDSDDDTLNVYDDGSASWVSIGGGADNLGNHTATQDLDMDNYNIDNAANIEAWLAIGSANKRWIPCMLEWWSNQSSHPLNEYVGRYSNSGGTDFSLYFGLPLPKEIGGKLLNLTRLRLTWKSVDGNDYIDRVRVYALSTTGKADVLDDSTNQTSGSDYTYDFTDYEVGSGIQRIFIQVDLVCTTLDDLKLNVVEMEYYYA